LLNKAFLLNFHFSPRYTQILQRPDLLKNTSNGKTKPFFSEKDISNVFIRLSKRLEYLRSEEALITVTSKFTASIMDLYVKNNNKVRLTGDRMKMLALVLPFALRDLLYQEVSMINDKIRAARPKDPLYRISLVEDPSDQIIEVLIKALNWHMMSREKELPIDKLVNLDAAGRDLLESLKRVLPERKGTKDGDGVFKGWCFEKAHSILHTPRNLLMYGYLEVTSAQGPEHCHIDMVKKIGHLTNNKEIFQNLLKWHSRSTYVRNIQRRLEISTYHGRNLNSVFAAWREYSCSRTELEHQDIALPCELGIRYPILQLAKHHSSVKIQIKVCHNFKKNQFLEEIKFFRKIYILQEIVLSSRLFSGFRFDNSLLISQSCGRKAAGLEQIDLFLLQSAHLYDVGSIPPDKIQYEFSRAHPVLRYLPSKLAEYIGENFKDELSIPDSYKNRGQWTVQGLNMILSDYVVAEKGKHLKTFGTLEWESELCEGRPKARCFCLTKFRNKVVQVKRLLH
jgi:hypothetical protein